MWPVVTYGCESWTLRKNEETRLDAFEMNGLRKILWVSWTAKKTNKWVLSKAGVHRQSKEASILWSHHELPGERDNARNNDRRAGEEDHARSGWTTSRRGQDFALGLASYVVCRTATT